MSKNKESRYFNVSEEVDAVRYGSPSEKAVGVLKIFGKGLFDVTKFAAKEVIPEILERGNRTTVRKIEEALKDENLSHEKRSELESIKERGSKEILKTQALKKSIAEKDRKAREKESSLKQRTRSTYESEAEAEAEAEKPHSSGISEPISTQTYSHDCQSEHSSIAENYTRAELSDLVSKDKITAKKTKVIFFVCVTLFILICFYGLYQGEKNAGETSDGASTFEIKKTDSVGVVDRGQTQDEQSSSDLNEGVSNPDTSQLMPDSEKTIISAEINQLKILSEQNHDCGTLEEVYCKSDLLKLATENAYSNSLRCEQGIGVTKDTCFTKAGLFIDHEFQKLELEKLNDAKYKLENAIGTRKANHFRVIEELVEPCKKEALANGHRDDYWEYTRSTCYPAAEKVYLQPEQAVLKKVDARLAKINFNNN